MNAIQDSIRQTRKLSGANIFLGLWLVLSPFVLGLEYSVPRAVVNDVIVGIIVLSFALIRVLRPLMFEGLSRVNFVLGFWLVFARWIIGYSNSAARINDVVTGSAIIVLAMLSVAATTRVPVEQRSLWIWNKSYFVSRDG